mgnify:CR=1 FL=1
MKLPNKIFTVNESCIGKFPLILGIIQKENTSVFRLYEATKNYFLSVTDFVETLDALFYLGKIHFNKDSEELTYAD